MNSSVPLIVRLLLVNCHAVLRSILGRTVTLCSAEEKDGGDGQDAAEDGVDQEDRPVEQREAAQLAYVQSVLTFAEKAVAM
jgi:hypothetical protein